MNTEFSDTLGFVEPADTLADKPADTAASRTGSLYGRLWRSVPRELGFLLLGLPIAVAGLGVLSGLFFPGVGTVIIWIGLFLVLAALYVARAFGTLQLVRLRWSGQPEVVRPQWRRGTKPRGFWRSTFGPLANGHYWLYLLHGLIINPIVSITTWAITIGWLATGLGGSTYWFWNQFQSHHGQNFFLSRTIFGAFFPRVDNPFDPIVGDAVLFVVLGIIFLVTLPFVTRVLTLLHTVIARGMLGVWRSDALQREVADLSASRGAAVSAEDQSLRKLERDIHDGPQQRLVRLQMDLASAGRKVDADPDAARALIDEASTQAKDALEELRALSRGFAPPILQDRGLVVALESLVARSTVAVVFENGLPAGIRFSPEVERNAYFVVAELLTNVSKHSGATAARLCLQRSSDAATGVASLDLWVSDNGSGGAAAVADHGLSGLQERLRGLRGSILIDSPEGGPTQISVQLPVVNETDRSLGHH